MTTWRKYKVQRQTSCSRSVQESFAFARFCLRPRCLHRLESHPSRPGKRRFRRHLRRRPASHPTHRPRPRPTRPIQRRCHHHQCHHPSRLHPRRPTRSTARPTTLSIWPTRSSSRSGASTAAPCSTAAGDSPTPSAGGKLNTNRFATPSAPSAWAALRRRLIGSGAVARTSAPSIGTLRRATGARALNFAAQTTTPQDAKSQRTTKLPRERTGLTAVRLRDRPQHCRLRSLPTRRRCHHLHRRRCPCSHRRTHQKWRRDRAPYGSRTKPSCCS